MVKKIIKQIQKAKRKKKLRAWMEWKKTKILPLP